MKKILFIVGVSLTLGLSAQTTEIKYKVFVPEDVKVKQALDTGVFGANGKYRELNLWGRANITSSKSSDSLYINYWLDPVISIGKQEVLKYYREKYVPEPKLEKLTAEFSRLGSDEYLGYFVEDTTFDKIKLQLDTLFNMQDSLTLYNKVKSDKQDELDEIKDSLALFADTLQFPRRTDSIYNVFRKKYTIAYKENAILEKRYKALKEAYSTYIDVYQKALKKAGIGWFPIDRKNIYVLNDTVKNTKRICAVKYDRTTDYTVRFQNREAKCFKFTCWDVGAVTIPFKYRFSEHKHDLNVPDETSVDINVGAFIGRSFGGIYYKYRRNGDLTPSTIRFTYGLMFSGSKVDLDSASTSVAFEPLSGTRSIGVFSIGTGFIFSAYDFRIGLFGGLDSGIGNVAEKWNYNNRPWVGIGIGYSLSSLAFVAK